MAEQDQTDIGGPGPTYDPDTDLPTSLWHIKYWRTRPDPKRPATTGWVVAILALIAIYNPLLNLVLPSRSHVVANLLLGALIVFVALRSGATWDNLALRATAARRGLMVGLVVAVAIVAVIAILTLVPASRTFFADDRFRAMGLGEMLYESLVRIPFATALFEEVVFRGVVIGLLLRRLPIWQAITVGCVLFGIWHVLPSFDAIETNPAGDLADGPLAVTVGVLGTVAFTATVGAGFAWLRFRGNSIITPLLAHIATNSAGFIAGWLVVSNGWA